MIWRKFLPLILSLPCLSPSIVYAGEGEFTGFVAVDTRLFTENPAHPGQEHNNGPTLVAEPEYYYISDDDEDTFTFRPFGRFDPYDSNRTHWDIRQLDWIHAQDDWEASAGISKVFWGVTESNHLVDIINQTDSIEDTDGEDKLGQPMLQFGVFKDWGRLRFYYLPYFRERTFPSVDGRLRGSIPIETEKAVYESSTEQWHPDFAVRYAHSFDEWDIGLAHFSGTSREPNFKRGINADGNPILFPVYEIIDQTSVDIQYTKDAWLWKFEGISRSGQGNQFFAAVGGLEYTFYSVFDTNADIGVLAEYSFDNREIEAPATLMDNDIFLGSRITLNDVSDTEFLGGIIFDHEDQTQFYVMETARRFGDNWKVELDVRFFSNINSAAPEVGINHDDHLQLRVARYF